MPKEQPYPSEPSLCATSSKNAKNKSNCMTLLAMRATRDADDTSGRGSRCSSEKDSGYSDVEDQQSNKSQSRSGERAETSQPCQTKEPGPENPGKPTLVPAGCELPPIFIINNMLQQPDMIQKRSQPPQINGSRETSSSGAAHMILFQPPSMLPATLQLNKPLAWKSNVTGKKKNGTYLPILNSYPRIAPHPSKKPPDNSSMNDESQNVSKRVCTEHMSDDTRVTRCQPEQHLYKQPKSAVPGPPRSSSTTDSPSSSGPTAVSSTQGSPPGSSLYTTSSNLTTKGHHRNGTTRTRQCFLNTVEILKQSGLLEIALRAKELLRQSNATERNIAQLRQHTELLCQAASNPSGSLSNISDWEHLHRSMAESGSYPNLKTLQNLQILCQPDSASQPASISTGGATRPLITENSEVPSSRYLTTIVDLNSEQGKELKAGDKPSEKVTFMPPDSSTG